jgi:hypothetical protein
VAQDRFSPPDRAERVRRRLAPPVALLASVVAVSCMLSVVDVARSLVELSAVDARFVGWVGVGAFAAIATAAVAILSADRVGSGPFLSLGAVAAIFGLSLGHQVGGRGQLTFAIVVCGLAFGSLLAGGVAMSSTLPESWARAALIAWACPLVVAWPLLTAATATGGAGPLPDLVVHPQTWVLAVVTAVVVAWSVLTMLVEPVPAPGSVSAPWEHPWSALLLLCAVAALMATLLGFDPQIPLVWLRPIVVTATAIVGAGWALTAVVVPGLRVRLAYVAVIAVAWPVPATAMFAVGVADAGHSAVGWPVLAVLVVAAAGGAVLGAPGHTAVVPLGLALTAVSAAATWVMSDEPWVMVAAVGPLVAFTTAVLVTAVRLVASDMHASRVIGLALIGSLVLGQLVAVPLDWAMLGNVPSTAGEMMASGRLDAGLTVAITSVAAAWSWIVHGRLVRRPATRAHPVTLEFTSPG